MAAPDRWATAPRPRPSPSTLTPLEADPSGGVYFVDILHSNSLRRILADGTVTTVATPPTFSGTIMTVDGTGNLYLSANPGIVRMDPSPAPSPR